MNKIFKAVKNNGEVLNFTIDVYEDIVKLKDFLENEESFKIYQFSGCIDSKGHELFEGDRIRFDLDQTDCMYPDYYKDKEKVIFDCYDFFDPLDNHQLRNIRKI